jgi:hypothetical protein
MKKLYLLLFIVSITFNSFSQWKIEKIDDGFDKSTFIHTDFYRNNDEGCKQPSYLSFVGNSLFLVADCNSGSKSDNWYIDIILVVNGEEKRFKAYGNGGYVFKRKILLINQCFNLNMNSIITDGNYSLDFLTTLLIATEIRIKAKNNFYETIYFKMLLDPSNTEQAWDANTGGKYLAEKKAKEEEIERKKKEEEERKILENKKREEDKIVIEKLNKLIEQNMIIEASNEYSKLYFKNANFENKIQKGLDNIYGNETQDLEKDKINQFIISNKESFNKIKSGSYIVKINNQGQIFFGETDHSKDFTFSPITKAINSSYNSPHF